MRHIWLLILLLAASTTQAATSQHAMAVSAQHYATEVGVDVLKKGGNAVDAAVAMGYALAVTYPCCGNIGGGGFMLIHFANGKNTFINFREKAPQAISTKLFLDAQGKPIKDKSTYGYLAAGIPGTVLGLNTALNKYGTWQRKAVMQPAIDLAKNGFILTAGDLEILNSSLENFKAQPNVAAIFLNHNQPYQVGDRLIQKDLAQTLETIAKEGSKAFYNGSITDAMVSASQKNGGVFSKQDFKNYSITESQPITCNYRNYKIITTPPPGSGTTVCEILNISNGYLLKVFGFHSVLATHYVAEAMRYAYADRNSYLGDPDFVRMPINKLISPQYAESIRAKISANKTSNSAAMGFVAKTHETANTTSYVVTDKAGNAVSVTYTINSNFGAEVIAGNTGFFLNDEMDDFALTTNTPNTYGLIQGKANLLAPNKRPLSSMSPTFVMKNNQLFMVLGTPGGSTIPTQLVETIQNVIDYHMNLQTAVDAPRFHMQWLPDVIFMEQNAFSNPVLDQLSNMGYKFKLGSPFGTPQWGKVTAIKINLQTHLIDGAMDERAPAGLALGY